jgi:hypothetical protein
MPGSIFFQNFVTKWAKPPSYELAGMTPSEPELKALMIASLDGDAASHRQHCRAHDAYVHEAQLQAAIDLIVAPLADQAYLPTRNNDRTAVLSRTDLAI